MITTIGNAFGENEMTLVAHTQLCPRALAPWLRCVQGLPDFVPWWDMVHLLAVHHGDAEQTQRALRVLTLAMVCFDSRMQRFLCLQHDYHRAFGCPDLLAPETLKALQERLVSPCHALMAAVTTCPPEAPRPLSAVPPAYRVEMDMDRLIVQAQTVLGLDVPRLPRGLFDDLMEGEEAEV
jgi:hypothetical protein